jgi:hypothetical protein
LIVIAESSDHLQRSSRRFAVRDSVAIWLLRYRFPRLAMFMAIVACGAIGLACSTVMHHCGLTAMWLRYPLAVVISGSVFTFFLGIFVRRTARLVDTARDEIRKHALRLQFHRNEAELPDPSGFMDGISEMSRQAGRQQVDPRALPAYLICILSITVVLVCVYFVWMAPVLLADIVVEGSLVAWLYRPLFRTDNSSGLSATIEKTAIPSLLLALAFVGIGLSFQLCAPQATTVAEVWRHLERQRNLVVGRPGGARQ